MADQLPDAVWLCPVHSLEFTVPHGGTCPDCGQELVKYLREPIHDHDHVLQVKGDGTWALEHPLRCRTGGQVLADCPVTYAAQQSVLVAGVKGRYRVRVNSANESKLVFLGRVDE
jgi:hypothetical protein